MSTLMPNIIVAETEDKQDKVIFYYNNTPYTCKQLTGLTYSYAASLINETIQASEDNLLENNSQGFLPPALSRFSGESYPSLEAFYLHQLNGVIEGFIYNEVFSIFKKTYPQNTDMYYNNVELQQSLTISAIWQQTFYSLLARALSENIVHENLSAYLRHHEWNHKHYITENLYRDLQHNRIYSANIKLFPYALNGKATPWYINRKIIGAFRYHLVACIEQDLDRYIKVIDSSRVRHTCMHFRNVQPVAVQSIPPLVAQLVDGKGNVAKGGVGEVNKILQTFGLDARVSVFAGTLTDLKERFELAELPPCRTLVELPAAIKSSRKSFLFICTPQDTHAWETYSSKPGNLVYDLAKDILVKPILHEIIQNITPAQEFKIRDEETLLREVANLYYSDKYSGGCDIWRKVKW